MSDTFHKPAVMNSQQRATQALKGIYCLLYPRQIQAGFSKESYSSAKGGKNWLSQAWLLWQESLRSKLEFEGSLKMNKGGKSDWLQKYSH